MNLLMVVCHFVTINSGWVVVLLLFTGEKEELHETSGQDGREEEPYKTTLENGRHQQTNKCKYSVNRWFDTYAYISIIIITIIYNP